MLTGSVSGTVRSEMVEDIKDYASTYFGEKPACIRVKVVSEEHHPNWSTIKYEAVVWHDIQHATSGPGKCKICGKENWPHRPLNVQNEFD